ncbi:hypothetical protein QBC35DRAFT_212398 [Podospora australis]|uniref:Uncharacterized protein n=1 Tax=Podospora australis TaxID=1536484 RepID=A0AAN6WV90_9PEZI|nr:hypothetical protein QBC35DRAFT_212398 [Podospora australis]
MKYSTIVLAATGLASVTALPLDNSDSPRNSVSVQRRAAPSDQAGGSNPPTQGGGTTFTQDADGTPIEVGNYAGTGADYQTNPATDATTFNPNDYGWDVAPPSGESSKPKTGTLNRIKSAFNLKGKDKTPDPNADAMAQLDKQLTQGGLAPPAQDLKKKKSFGQRIAGVFKPSDKGDGQA